MWARTSFPPGRLGLVLALAISGATVGAGETRPETTAPIPLSISTIDLGVDDGAFSPHSVDSLLSRLLQRPSFVEMHLPKEKILAEYFELPNHLSAANRGEADPLGLSVDLELEQCWYGRSSDAEKKFASFFFFGFAGIFPHSAKDVSEDNGIEGFVEWRARVSGQTIESPLVIVARGRCFGDVRDLGRRAALLVANRRALWDPIVQLELALGGRGIIALHKKVVSIGQRQYLEMQDNW